MKVLFVKTTILLLTYNYAAWRDRKMDPKYINEIVDFLNKTEIRVIEPELICAEYNDDGRDGGNVVNARKNTRVRFFVEKTHGK